MTTFVDHYEVLGLPTGEEGMQLTNSQIRKGFKIKALEVHPDKRPADEVAAANADFQYLQDSFQVLMDAQKRELFHTVMSAQPKKQPATKIVSDQGFPESCKTTMESIYEIFKDSGKVVNSMSEINKAFKEDQNCMTVVVAVELTKILIFAGAMVVNLHKISKEIYGHCANLSDRLNQIRKRYTA